MAKVDTAFLKDSSGNTYEFNVYPLDTEWKDFGALYTFLKKKPEGNYTVLYIGKAKSMCDRHADHEKWDSAKKLGMTHIAVRTVTAEADRQALEKKLISFHQPQLNTHHVTQQTAGKSGLYR